VQLFPRIQYLKGGVASGFKHVEKAQHETKLFQITSTRWGQLHSSPCCMQARLAQSLGRDSRV
jgi:hypothetical protein